jgi:glycerol-3-phosphate cytidylyltransferase
MKKILTYGTFDLLHYGHFELLRRARELGDYLVVAVSTDEFNAEKGKGSHFPYEKRVEMLQAIRYVDEVIPEKTWDQKVNDVKENKIDVFVMGSDWDGKFDNLKDYCEVVYLARTPDVSSTALKNLRQPNNEN